MNSSRPVRVLHLIDGLRGGGCERALWDIVRLSPPDAFEHRVVTVHPDSGNFVYADRMRSQGAYYQPGSPRVLSFIGRRIQDLAVQERLVPVRKLLTFMWRLGGYGLASLEMLKALIGFRPDVIHTHGYDAFVAGLAIRAILRKPLMHTVPATFSQMKDARYGWTPALYSRVKSSVDYFLTGASYADLIGLGIPESKICFLPGGADLHAVSAVKNDRDRYYAEIRNSLGLPQNVHVALSVGRLHPSKGHLFALESLPTLLPEFPNLHWVVLGEGLQRAKLEAKAEELGVAEHVHLIGFRLDPLPYFAAADIYLRTPVLEADNLSSYQAVAMGLPVVGFDTGNETESIKKVGNGILVPNRDGEAFARAISSILKLPDCGKAMGTLGAEFSHNHLDIRHIMAPFFTAYATLAYRPAKRKQATKSMITDQ